MEQRFLGKAVVVIGGNSGIGLATAKAFAAEGAQVAITGRSRDTLQAASREIGHGVGIYCSDVRDVQQIALLFESLHRDLGRIDVLFVNAGVSALLPIECVTEAEWDRVHDTNLKGAFFSVQAALPMMTAGSSIILTGSIAAVRADVGVLVYAASKAGLRALGRSLANELIGRKIRVNVVSPGPIEETDLVRRASGVPTASLSSVLHSMTEAIPMKRMGTPEEVAGAVLFLASDAAAFVTGIDFLVDGGIASLRV